MACQLIHGDCLDHLRAMDNDSVDLVFCSPPYENRRTYDELQFNLSGQRWVDWAFSRYMECVRVCRGVVAWVIEGQTASYRWSATPILLMSDLHRAGVLLRKPPIYYRVGIPGSGGPDWLRNDYEFILCSSKGKLPWSDNTACGHAPKYGPGGRFSNRNVDGQRLNKSHRTYLKQRRSNGKRQLKPKYEPPAKAKPGNVIWCHGGGGHFGHSLAHHNEAPFPESLVEPFVLSFCPPGGVVLDPFCGSGTTLAVARRHHRRSIGIDIRESQIDLSKQRLKDVQPMLIKETP